VNTATHEVCDRDHDIPGYDMTAARYADISISGGDTATPRNLAKRLEVIARYISPSGRRILDAGCGAGEYVAALSALGADAIGIEYDAEKVRRWADSHPRDGRVRQGDLSTIDLPSDSVDAVLLNEVLEHVPDEATVLREIRRVLGDGGMLLVFSPNRRFPFETHGVDLHRAGRRLSPALTFGLPWLPLAITQRLCRPWARNYWPRELSNLIHDAGFEIVSRDFIWQTFENISGRQPSLVGALRPLLRTVANLLERIPGLRTFGASQVVVARKPTSGSGRSATVA
jgi:SAM-dependent methyltransferase